MFHRITSIIANLTSKCLTVYFYHPLLQYSYRTTLSKCGFSCGHCRHTTCAPKPCVNTLYHRLINISVPARKAKKTSSTPVYTALLYLSFSSFARGWHSYSLIPSFSISEIRANTSELEFATAAKTRAGRRSMHC